MSVITALLIIFFGALTIWFEILVYKNEAHNHLSKFCNYFDHRSVEKKSLLQSLMGSTLAMEDRGWMLLTKRIIIFLLALPF